MKRFLASLFFCVPFFLFSEGNVEGLPSTGNPSVDVLINSLNSELNQVSTSVDNLLNDVEYYYSTARSITLGYVEDSMGFGGDGQSYQQGYLDGLAFGAINIVDGPFQDAMTQLRSRSTDIITDVDSAQSYLISIARDWHDIPEDILQAISNNTEMISWSVTNVLQSSMETNVQACVSNVSVIARLLKSVFPASTNIPDNVSEDIEGLENSLDNLVIDFEEFWVKTMSLVDFLNDEEQNFKKYLDRALERMNRPDPKMRTSLRDMWDDMLLHRAEILRGWMNTNSASYTPGDQAEVVIQQLSQDFHLSNEGEIALENLAVNQRSYLCLAELVNRQQSPTNQIADLSWITNFLASIVQPYYQNWNQTLRLPPPTYNPFFTSRFNLYTNFTESALSGEDRATLQSKWNAFQTKETNYWSRLEFYLLSLNGFMGNSNFVSDEDSSEVDNTFDKENATRRVDYMTNAFFDVSAQMADSSNIVNRLVAKFKEFNDAFQLPEGDWDQVLRLTPEFSLGEVEVPAIYFSMRDVENISGAVKQVCTCLWYAIFAFLGFRLVLAVFLLLGKAVRSLVLLVATFLN